MDSYQIDRIRQKANTEVIRRLLIKYFMEDKGFADSFDRQLYPSLIQDLPSVIPVLSSKVEIVPHMDNLDNIQGKAIIGWNMFVLGNQRMYLGETYHNDLASLARQIKSGCIMIPEGINPNATRQTTPRRVIHFITRALEDRKSGYVDLSTPSTNHMTRMGANSAMGMQSQFYTKSGYGA